MIAFIFLLLALILARSDQGIIPAIATNLKEQFKMNSFEVGSLGSATYLGATVGCLAAIPLLDYVPTKWALLSCLVAEAISFLVFTLVDDFYHMSIARFCAGASQVILAIFLPVWVDAFAPKKFKTLWMTISISATGVGTLVGYGLAAAAVTVSDSWHWAFYIMMTAMIIPIVYLIMADPEIIDVKEHLRVKQEQEIPEVVTGHVNETGDLTATIDAIHNNPEA